MILQCLGDSRAGKWSFASQSEVKGASQRINVAACVRLSWVFSLLRRDIVHRPQEHAGGGKPAGRRGCEIMLFVRIRVERSKTSGLFKYLCKSHVEEFHAAIYCEHDVMGLDVTVDNPLRMGILQCPGHFEKERQRTRETQAAA